MFRYIFSYFKFTFLFNKIIPPKALLGSLLYDLRKADLILLSDATPHGLVCLIIIDVGF